MEIRLTIMGVHEQYPALVIDCTDEEMTAGLEDRLIALHPDGTFIEVGNQDIPDRRIDNLAAELIIMLEIYQGTSRK